MYGNPRKYRLGCRANGTPSWTLVKNLNNCWIIQLGFVVGVDDSIQEQQFHFTGMKNVFTSFTNVVQGQ